MYLINCTNHGTDDEHSLEIVNTHDSIDFQNSLGTISTKFSSDDRLNLCRLCTVIGSQHLGGLNMLAVDQNTSFVDV